MQSAWSSRWMWLMVSSLGLVACGGAQEVARPTGPVKKVAWSGAEAETAADEPAADENQEKAEKAEPEEVDLSSGGNVIDLDAPTTPKAAPKPPPSAAAEPPVAAAAAVEEEEEAEEEEPAAKAEPEPESPSNDPLAAELRKRRAQAKARSEANKEKAPPKKKRKGKPAAEGEGAVASYKGADPCRAPSFSVARVREACASGGRPAAKRVMKDAIGKATATGQPLKCGNCHSNQRDYALKGDAVAELERWLASSSS